MAPEDLKNKSKGHLILIVDDDEFLLNMYLLKFKQAGFEVVTATGGEMAIAKLRDGLSPDVLMLDIIMPAMDGLEALEEIRKANLAKDAVVVVLTNQGQISDIDRAKKLGVQGYIVKASTIPSEVLAEVLDIIKKHKK